MLITQYRTNFDFIRVQQNNFCTFIDLHAFIDCFKLILIYISRNKFTHSTTTHASVFTENLALI